MKICNNTMIVDYCKQNLTKNVSQIFLWITIDAIEMMFSPSCREFIPLQKTLTAPLNRINTCFIK